jgi:hypothetical protein
MDREVRELTGNEVDHVSGGAITTETINPQGHVTQGTPGQAQTTVATNPAGHEPPGQQP